MSTLMVAVAGSYLVATGTSRRIAQRNYDYHSLSNVLETGVDRAMYSLGQLRLNNYKSTTWSDGGWTSAGVEGYAQDFGKKFPLGDGRFAGLKVTIQNVPDNAAGTNTGDGTGKLKYPYIVAEATFEPGSASAYTRQAMVVLAPSTSNSITGGLGMSAKGKLTFGNNTPKIYFDSYTSAGGATYGGTNTTAGITVATAGTDGDVSGSGTVYGYALIGTGDATAAFQAFKVYSAIGAANTDSTRIASGYIGNFTLPADPSTTTNSTNVAVSGTQTITGGTAANPKYYTLTDFKLTGSNVLTISGNVVIFAKTDISMSGNNGIQLQDGASLTIYTSHDVSVAGNGIMNMSSAGATIANNSALTSQLKIYGTNPTAGGQAITFSGNGAFSGVVFAPNAKVTFNGGGSSGVFYGALTGNTVTVNGQVSFHYDQSLGSAAATTQIVSGYAATNWVELKDAGQTVKMSDYGL